MIKLNVPFAEKDEAKKLGAMWDSEIKKWYVPRKKYGSLADFKKWLPLRFEEELMILQAPIYLVQTTKKCWKCYSEIDIHAIANDMKNNVLYSSGLIDEDLQHEGSDDDFYYKQFGFNLRFLMYTKQLTVEDFTRIQKTCSNYEMKYSKTVQYKYLANVCPYCNMLQGDFGMFEEPDEGFMIMFNEKQVKLNVFEEKFDLLFYGDIIEWH